VSSFSLVGYGKKEKEEMVGVVVWMELVASSGGLAGVFVCWSCVWEGRSEKGTDKREMVHYMHGIIL
jgi:hypothetical protein